MNLAKKLLMTTGNSSGAGPAYVDDVFSAYTYTGNGSTQTINNGIDLAGEGGLVWIKGRSGATDHVLYDTARGATLDLVSNSTAGQITQSTGLTTFGNSGFSVGSLAKLNTNSSTYTSWTFRKAQKFFDVVTYTGDGASNRQIAHGLGVAPGMIVVKCTSNSDDWPVYHRSLGATHVTRLNSTIAAQNLGITHWNNTAPTSSVFSLGYDAGVNGVGQTYVAYLFAHDPSTDVAIQCGSFTGNTTVNIGWEPQWIMIKRTDAAGDWIVIDSMRGCSVGDVDAVLNPNLSNAESVSNDYIDFTATGFITKNLTGTYIYTVVRRPNKPPTSGTQVYNAIARAGTGAAATVTGVGFAPDLVMCQARSPANLTSGASVASRLIGIPYLRTSLGNLEIGSINLAFSGFLQNGISIAGAASNWNDVSMGTTYINHFFKRAKGFFDVVCDTGTGVAHAIAHNLTKAPELIIRKSRSAETQWEVWHSALVATEKLVLNSNTAKATDATAWNSTLPTATQFTVGTGANVNANTATFVTYLFATLAGISKVGSYSGNGGTQTIPCGFTTGSRFILIKRIDNTGDWFVWDTTRGITPTTDPHLSLNTAAAEVTTDDSIDQDASGFIVNQNAATNINALGGNYLFLAIA